MAPREQRRDSRSEKDRVSVKRMENGGGQKGEKTKNDRTFW